MPKKNVLLISSPGGGKTVALETLPCGTILFNFDPGGWKSLDRSPIEAGKVGRKPKRLLFTKTLIEWVANKENTLQPDNILVVDYSPGKLTINDSLLCTYDATVFHSFAKDINILETPPAKERGICHIALDSLTGLQWAVLEAIVNLAGHTGTGTSQYSYGKAIEKMREIVDTCCMLPYDFVLTAHIRSDKDDVTGKVMEEISIYGKALPELIVSMIDDVYVCTSDLASPKKYWWETSPGPFLKIVRQRSFDGLPIRVEPNFALRYPGGLYTTPVLVTLGEGVKK
jgi:hypothetical protein